MNYPQISLIYPMHVESVLPNERKRRSAKNRNKNEPLRNQTVLYPREVDAAERKKQKYHQEKKKKKRTTLESPWLTLFMWDRYCRMKEVGKIEEL